MGPMSNLGGGLPGSDGSQLPGYSVGDPGAELKGKGMPWPVYLLIAIVAVAGIGYLGLRSVQNRNKRKLHVTFMESFAAFEKDQVGAFWKCMFGKDGDGRRFNAPEQLNMSIETNLYSDPKTYPEKVSSECVKKAMLATSRVKDLSPPAEYETAVDEYGKALAALANTLNTWAESAPKRVEIKLREKKIDDAGNAWSTTANVNKAEPAAWLYDKFLHCAVPEIDKFKDTQGLLEFLADKCVQKKGKEIDQAFIGKLRDTCIPESQEEPAKAPPTFKGTFNKFSGEYDRMAQAWGFCFRKMNKESKKDDLQQVDQAWVTWLNSSTGVRKIGAAFLKDE